MRNYCRNDVEDNEIALKWESISSDGAGYLPLQGKNSGVNLSRMGPKGKNKNGKKQQKHRPHAILRYYQYYGTIPKGSPEE